MNLGFGVMKLDTLNCMAKTYQASGNTNWASGLVVMTSRLQRGDRLFNSGLAHYLGGM